MDETSRKKGDVAEKHSSFISPLQYRKVTFSQRFLLESVLKKLSFP